MANEKIKQLESAFAQSVENLTKAFEGLKAEIIKVDKSALEVEPLKVGDNVKFIGERNDFNNYVTNGKIYKISEVDGDGDFLFEDDRELGAKIGSFISPSTRHLFQLVEEEPVKVKSANEQRAELIERERKYIEEGYHLKKEFIVNEDKKTVVCLLRGHLSGTILHKGIAKCMEGDVFNATLGKSISFRKAKREVIPHDLMHTVQPTEVVVGMKVKTLYEGTEDIVPGIPEDVVGKWEDTVYPSFNDGTYSSSYKIFNDTNAEYSYGK